MKNIKTELRSDPNPIIQSINNRTYHFYGGALYQYCFCEGGVVGLHHIDPLPLQNLHNSVVIQTIIVGVGVYVGQR